MNQKRDEITRFLEEDLLPQVQEAFGIYKSADKAELEEELEKTIQSAKAAGFDPEESPKVKEVREGLAKYGVDTTALENEVFSDLYNFFRRYYHEGDFLSLRRYKEGIYAIPYEGEEVKLHWANHDQYYIKTSEYFRDYTFKLPSGKRVHFKLVEADTEKDNIKAQTGNERRFIPCEEETLEEIDGELYIRFQYAPDPEKRKQTAINEHSVGRMLGLALKNWPELGVLQPTEKNPQRTLLEKHLTDYTARNTFDYFIHKDLDGFLKRELDFYIKNEIMHLDDIENETALRVEQYLSKIKVIRKIAHKIIDFLAQIENFQKKMWLKKKFVVETNYCVTLDRVPEGLYPEIIANDAQREEWVRLFAIDEIPADAEKSSEKQEGLFPATSAVKYSEPLTVEFLKANPLLVVDTGLFNNDFKIRLIASMEDLDEQCDGLLIHSENFQALNLLQERYHEQVKCIYIDPPYNTGDDGFPYKDSYRHSSWYTMLKDRVLASFSLLEETAAFWMSSDDHEIHGARQLMDSMVEDDFNAIIPVVNNLKGRNDRANIATAHEYLLFYSINGFSSYGIPLTDEQRKKFKYLDESGQAYDLRDLRKRGRPDRRQDRPNMWFPIYFNEKNRKCSLARTSPEDIEITPKKSDGTDGRWRWGKERVAKNLDILHPYFNERGNKWEVSHHVYLKNEGGERTSKPKSFWMDPSYSTDVARRTVVGMLPEMEAVLGYPKAVSELRNIVHMSVDDKEIIIDYFAGTGTTGHAVIDLNREDGGQRKYILVEMGEHFDAVLIRRIKNVIYSKDWKDGKPVSREGSSHMFKYMRLESYEDTLNNLELKRTEAQQSLLDQSDSFRESYMLSYMLDVETKGSESLLNLNTFEDPFNYKLNISTGSAGETRPVTVDVVETFDYLIGLTVNHIDSIRGFRVIQGTSPKGEKVLVIWRNQKEKSNKDLDEFFRKQEYNPKDMEFDLIYVNGDNNLENLRREDETWKVRLIEEDFKRLMFDVQDV